MDGLSLGVMLAAAAAETAVTGAPEVAGGGWISGDTLTSILYILCGAGGPAASSEQHGACAHVPG